jgi:predicted nucleotidyltransferase
MSRSGKISPTHVPLPSQGTCASPLLYVRLKDFLYEEYGARLRGVVLYGSEARGEATPTSDIDVLVLLDGPVRFGEELRRVIHALYPVQLEIDRPLHAVPLAYDVYEAGRYAWCWRAKHEGRWV